MRSYEPLCRAAEQMSLPSEVLGASRIEITGSRQVLLCGHKGVRLLSDTEIIVELPDCAASVRGAELAVLTMTRSELLIHGRVDSLSLLR